MIANDYTLLIQYTMQNCIYNEQNVNIFWELVNIRKGMNR